MPSAGTAVTSQGSLLSESRNLMPNIILRGWLHTREMQDETICCKTLRFYHLWVLTSPVYPVIKRKKKTKTSKRKKTKSYRKETLHLKKIKRIFSHLDVVIASGQHTRSANSLCIICNSSIKPKPFCGLCCSTRVDCDIK